MLPSVFVNYIPKQCRTTENMKDKKTQYNELFGVQVKPL